ncbi:DUF5050 domain-containing protein [Paenibacillus ginsengarvi]|uniref:DUF5050 domain-containing protein n=1 Tax=Paenibacillus ginsengarvi TaxID=400777 RepID=UPI0011C3E51D|nr:DUF5050 domain-containing protein [Paenibacillus ginsengarvi]
MRRKWAGCAAALAVIFSLLAPAVEGRAASTGVRVSLPDFQVSLNGHAVDQTYREYPLLVYKDITYFPMTWSDSRLLGLEAAWTPESGLRIAQGPVSSPYVSYQADRRNAASYNAEISGSAITINGKSIDNSKEPYPLLSFRDVTYFPLTWRFAHDEFDWEYRYDDARGLDIRSRNPQILIPDLPTYASDNEVALYKGYYYFAETAASTNQVYRTPLKNPSEKELVYSYEFLAGNDFPRKTIHFRILDNELWFSYFLGSNLMGSNTYVKVNEDGKGEKKFKFHGYTDFKKTPYGTLIIALGPNSPGGNNLSLAAPGQNDERGKTVGDSHMYYSRYVSTGNSGYIVDGIGTGDSAEVVGDDIYIRATKVAPDGYSDLNQIYKIDLQTNETEKIVNAGVSRFRILGEKLYYVKDTDNALYSSALNGTGERKLSENAVSWFDGIDDKVYYTTSAGDGKYRLYRINPDGDDTLVLQSSLDGVQVLNGKMVCRLDEKEEYRTMVLDGSGRLVLAMADPISRLLASDDAIVFTTSGDPDVKVIR